MKQSLHFARSCYQHLAGKVSVALCERFIEQKWVILSDEGSPLLTKAGIDGLRSMGMDVVFLEKSKRSMLRFCLDGSEKKPHLAGEVGNRLLRFFLDEGWFQREGTSRKLVLTDKGERLLNKMGVSGVQVPSQ
ncbi:hypothetical protein [Marininema halotolerans]|uniref:Uncharacterized protein n=1 Tax=Marininema halotolerans TaxID=1155944 RepID=A0A1I6U3F5_9BACL|nr:hypothetical protein [Marininema halotolerans]SFS96039.1 hypothetical protein SAMN05444972_11344 [Marininema halotolerans]